MQSTWLDNDHNNNENNSRRIDSASKKLHGNRIQVYTIQSFRVSKISPTLDQIQQPLNFQPTQINLDKMNQTCVDRKNGIPFRRLNTT